MISLVLKIINILTNWLLLLDRIETVHLYTRSYTASSRKGEAIRTYIFRLGGYDFHVVMVKSECPLYVA